MLVRRSPAPSARRAISWRREFVGRVGRPGSGQRSLTRQGLAGMSDSGKTVAFRVAVRSRTRRRRRALRRLGRGTLPGTMGRQRRARKPRFRIYLAFSCGEVAEWPKAAVCQGCQESENGPEIDDFRPVSYWDVGWPWLPNDGPWTKFGHTGGHTGVDANVCLTGTRCGTVAK